MRAIFYCTLLMVTDYSATGTDGDLLQPVSHGIITHTISRRSASRSPYALSSKAASGMPRPNAETVSQRGNRNYITPC